MARRLTSHPGEESSPTISPDGKILAFTAEYEGPSEIYTMPLEGGLPTRRTFQGEWAIAVGWTPDGKLIYTTEHYSTLPDAQLAVIDLSTGKSTPIPLRQASEGTYDPSGKTLFFTRLPFQGSHTKRYKGGTAQNLWKYIDGQPEAVALTTDYPGTSKNPMWWKGRVYFASDRDGTMNIWSMREDGRDLRQHTHHRGWDVQFPSLSEGKIVYQLGADLHLYDTVSNQDTTLDITLTSDFDQTREKWVRKPMEYLTAAHLSPDGDRIVLTARGQVFVAPATQGRFVEATRKKGIRYRGAFFMPDGKTLLALTDESGELEFCKIPANGIGDPERLTNDGKVFRFDGAPSPDGKKLMVRKGEDFYVIDSSSDAAAKLDDKQVNLKDWTFSLIPREEWRHMFTEAWRLERDYFYDPKLHGVDWPGLLQRYLPLADRVTTRGELSDLISQLVGELSALHIFVVGGDFRKGPDEIMPASLGAALVRDEQAGGYRIEHVYKSEPDYVNRLSPLAKPGLGVKEQDVILAIDGVPTLSAPLPAVLLRNKAGKQALLRIRSGDKTSEVIVNPIPPSRESNLRYDDWEYSRRLRVEDIGKGEIGYVHLRAMGGGNYSEWAGNFYPVFDRKGLIIDVRHNRGGNIDSWILEKLLRKAWFFWQPRVGNPTWNMQYAFRGHVVVLCDQYTASDGEAFTEGFRRLGLGKVIGTRTWGGEIWLSFDNWLEDNGIASAAETGVYGPEGKWLIEGHGVDPDIVVDNLPHATFGGQDAQLEAAVRYLQEQIRLHPVTVPPAPLRPDKSIK
jgi:C-terminal processing protease CtpA/Prc/Tol biopolymer transport system component